MEQEGGQMTFDEFLEEEYKDENVVEMILTIQDLEAAFYAGQKSALNYDEEMLSQL